ncbi:MAG: glycosyltransferase family 4 protein [bacterium]
MKIAVLIGRIAQIGGVLIAAFEEVRYLRKLGYDAELVVLKETNFAYQDLADDIPIRFLSREFSWIFKKSFRIPFFSFFSLFHLTAPIAASRVIKNNEYDIVIVHETYNCFSALALKKKRGIPFIAFLWDPITYILPRVYKQRFLGNFLFLLMPLARYLDKKIVEEADSVILGSNVHKNKFKGLGNIEKTELEIIPPGCYPLQELPKERKGYILALTKWDIGKNPCFLLNVLKYLKNKEVKMVVAGNWVQQHVYDEFIKKAKEYNLLDRIEITGRIDEKTKKEFLSEALVLVHPIFEAFGMMCLEAAGCGCSFIIPKGSGVTDLFINGEHGYFPEEGDLGKYVKKIDYLIDNPDTAFEMGRGAWEVAKKNTWKEHAIKISELIKVHLNDK